MGIPMPIFQLLGLFKVSTTLEDGDQSSALLVLNF